jgi:putative aldouronate transport system substrate-binding protein
LDKECFKQTDTQGDEKVGNGTALFYASQMSLGVNSTKLTGLYNAHPEMRYVPVGPMNDMDGNPLVATQSNGRSGSPALFFPTTCSNIEAALTYVDYINTKEGATLSYYGIEGETYTLNDQGQPRLNKDLLDRKAAGDLSWEDDLRAVGGHGYIADSMLYGIMKMEWFGESAEGDADAAIPDIEAYKKMRPNKILEGYPISAYQNQSPDWESVSTNELDSSTQNDYCQRAFFADTEDEARQILTDYQNKIKTDNNGELMTFLDFLTSKLSARDDIVF